ncbi:DUF2127 domain-containing protein [Capillimicrobium parvum]|uniref:DUF2127 domain-containing protein n=1 Tax=Capillimicrobium parvum TaxID=2884022 RepID=A0A9E7BZG2_9ACTN|nr:DUF2127 domain-containing protein [Capillimicrobium parvum]UGS34544.1 hypothetical protein DSM104329_00923 [Capillimicrobium parvum]
MARDLPGTTRPRRFVPRLHYELIVCGVRGHELLGLDVAHVRPEDAIVVRPGNDGVRWHRCLRCDSWLPLPQPSEPSREVLPPREAIEVPLRGKALRDKIVLRTIAVDRAFHFVLLAVIAVAIFLFAANEASLRDPAYRVLADLQGAFNGSSAPKDHGVLHDVRRLFSISHGTLTKIGLLVAAYALLEGAEAVGLWLGKRWAEYLTFIATAGLMPLEIYEIVDRASVLKALTFVVNLAIVVYLLYAKRLFGIREGGAAEQAEREADVGWPALERATPA